MIMLLLSGQGARPVLGGSSRKHLGCVFGAAEQLAEKVLKEKKTHPSAAKAGLLQRFLWHS
jgi:hypothetical protein